MKRFCCDWRWFMIVALLLGTVALITGFGREVAHLAYISLSRARDKAGDAILPPIFARNYEDVVQSHTEQTTEIERYLNGLRQPARQTPEALGFDFTSEANYLRSRETVRSLLASSLSYPPPKVVQIAQTPSLERLAQDELATYYEISVPVLEGVNARGVFMMPHSTLGKVPLVIAAHGRGGKPARPKGGKLSVISRNNRDLAFGALKKGYAVWQPIFAFYAEEHPTDIRDRLEVRARESGTTLPAIEIAKIIGGLNALTQMREIDPARIAMVGVSYGGFYTLYTTALDDRIQVAVVAAYFNDREAVLDSSEPYGFFDWRFRNSLSVFQDATMAALICPRPLQVQAGDHDQLFPIHGVRKVVPAARQPYERLNIKERFSFVEFVGRHDFNGDAAWNFIDRFFEPRAQQHQAINP